MTWLERVCLVISTAVSVAALTWYATLSLETFCTAMLAVGFAFWILEDK